MTTAETSIGIFTTNTDLIVRSWDSWLAAVSGLPASATRGRRLPELFPDVEARGLLTYFRRVLDEGVVEVLAPAFHHYLIPVPSPIQSRHFDHMQQRVTIAPLRDQERIVGTIVTVQDVTMRREWELDLAEQLRDPDEAVRLRAARMLAEEADVEPGAGLFTALDDDSWRVRRAAVEGLARRGGPDTVTTLLRALHDEHHNVSILNSALEVLALTNTPILPALLEFLSDPDADLRIYAALALGDRHDRQAVAALMDALDDPDPNVRFHVVEALGKLRATEAVDRLVAIAEARDFFLAFPALEALSHIGDARVAPRLVPLLEDDMLRSAVADALGVLGDEEAVEPLARLLNSPHPPTLAIAHALVALHERYDRLYGEAGHIADLAGCHITAEGTHNLLESLEGSRPAEIRVLALVLGWLEGPEVERALTRLLGQPDVRREAVEALVRYGTRVTDLLVQQLDAEDVETREAAVVALGRIGDARAVPALIGLLSEDGDLAVLSAGALAKIGDGRAFEALLTLIGHREAAVRQAAVGALNSIGHPDMARRVVALLEASDPRSRESAVKIAGYFAYPEALEALLACCHDPVEGVRIAAIEHVAYVADPRVLPILATALADPAPRVRAAAARALGHVDPMPAWPYLRRALNDADPWVQYYAARSVGRHGYPEAAEPLTGLARATHASQVQIAAVEALGQIGGALATAVLAGLIESPERDLARSAMSSLGLIRYPDALVPLLAALQAPDPGRRIDALHALGGRRRPEIVAPAQWIAASDADPAVVEAAIEVLAHAGLPEAVAALVALTADPGPREGIVAALARLDDEGLSWVALGLNHPHGAVRGAVVEALARSKRSQAAQELVRALDDPDPQVRLAAVTAFRQLGDRRAEQRLAALARADPDMGVRRAAYRALQPDRGPAGD